MNPNQLRPWWLRKHVWLPLALIAGLTVASVVAFVDSDASTLMIYNETGRSISALKVAACGQETVLRGMDEEESFRWQIKETGTPGEITLESAANPPWRWQGGYIQTRGGYRVTLRLWPDGEVELHTQISLWQRLFRNAPNINN
ncbi:MAG: hypothetical protein WCS42_01550 [Verrucomicrobiota bacterium]